MTILLSLKIATTLGLPIYQSHAKGVFLYICKLLFVFECTHGTRSFLRSQILTSHLPNNNTKPQHIPWRGVKGEEATMREITLYDQLSAASHTPVKAPQLS